jgi:Fur family zinc uptake transcriptional regulator
MKSTAADSPRLTRNQHLVLGALEEERGPLSAYAILDRLRDDGFRAPLQVYRALDKLREYALVHRLESLKAFVACRHPECHDHGTLAFAICQECGSVAEFSDDRVVSQLGTWADKNGFRTQKSVIEISGTCRGCAR